MAGTRKYEVVGNHTVAGASPGETVTLDLPDENIAALVASGHIAKPKPKKKQTGDDEGDA